MPRIRTIKPEWLDDEKLAAADDAARVLSVGLIVLADDYGRGRANKVWLGAQVWSYMESGIDRMGKVAAALVCLARIGYITLYAVREESYYAIRNWQKHQKVDHPGRARVPAPEDPGARILVEELRELPQSSAILASPRETLGNDLGPRTEDLGPRTSTETTTEQAAGARVPVPTSPETEPAAPAVVDPRLAAAIVRVFPDLASNIEGQLSMWLDAYPGVDLLQLAKEARSKAGARGRPIENAAALLSRWYQRAYHEQRAAKDAAFLAEHAKRKREEAAERRLNEQLQGAPGAKPIGADIEKLMAVVGLTKGGGT